MQMLKFEEEVGRVKGKLKEDELEVLITNGQVNGGSQYKKFLVNGVAKRRVDFAGSFSSAFFASGFGNYY
jgi:DNA replication and repair protein RecF